MVSTIPFKVPTKIFDYLPKERKWLIVLILVIILALKYFLFIFSFGYVIVTLINFFRRNDDKY
jgi:CDP-diacylglycerol--serine O-phosphatidyltransferase